LLHYGQNSHDLQRKIKPFEGILQVFGRISAQHPIVSTHKVTGRYCLYLGSDTSILKGLEDQPEVAKQYWQELFTAIVSCTPVYAHIWQRGDIVFWDNSQVMHTGMRYDANKYQRIALRVGVVNILKTVKD
jgi:taurine dioxygenase